MVVAEELLEVEADEEAKLVEEMPLPHHQTRLLNKTSPLPLLRQLC